MASLIIGKNLGLAPHAELVSVKISNGINPTDPKEIMDNLDAAMEIIFKDFENLNPESRFGVISLSYDILNRADVTPDPWRAQMTRAADLGLIFMISHKRHSQCFEDQPNTIPSQRNPPKSHEIIVGASNEFNEVSYFSNRGSCIDLWAPGSRVTGALKGEPPNVYGDSDGTSMSTAFVAGMIAYTKSCLLAPNQKATRDVFIEMFTRDHIPVLEPLVSVIQGAQPWLAKLPITLATNFAEKSHVQVPMDSHNFVRNVKWNIISVTSSNRDYISKHRTVKWAFDTDLLDPSSRGKGVTVYLLDSGVDFQHPDFAHTSHIEAGGAINIDQVQKGNSDARQDSSRTGHGTRMASLIVGAVGGVSIQASLFPIKICGSGDDCAFMDVEHDFMSRIYHGVRMAVNHFKTVAKVKKGIVSINWPLSYDYSGRWKQLMKEAEEIGLHVVIPAGDNHDDRCFTSDLDAIKGKTHPEKYHEFVVGASTEWNEVATFSNAGKCVDVWAPGTHVFAAVPTSGSNPYETRDGTAQSSAIVTGVVAGILSQLEPMVPANRQLVYKMLISKDKKVADCESCLLGAQPYLAKRGGNLAYPD
ncbi:peptidase S8/S53 domain-containing protein [Flagelloscypha sp. PMI_526]|nr:peptidase S8/S53 domain-containing protein [Flagelloscypha sp. PMI_526]